MSEPSVLPDSRLTHRPDFGSVICAWPLPGGKTVRLEAVRVYCANCGKLYGLVPKDNTTFAFWLCTKCSETFGPQAGLMAVPDEAFAARVADEMTARFGRVLTAPEIAAAKECGLLGRALELLEKESPYQTP